MKTKIFVLAMLSVLVLSPAVYAQCDHLEPPAEYFYKYSNDHLFLIGLDNYLVLRFFVVGHKDYKSEFALTIEKNKFQDSFLIAFNYLEKKKVVRIAKEISTKSVEPLRKLFEFAIYQTKYCKEPLGKLGFYASYYLSIWDYGIRTGTTSTPEHGKKLDKLIDISMDVVELAIDEEEIIEFDDSLIEDIEELIKEFEEDDSLKNKQKPNDN